MLALVAALVPCSMARAEEPVRAALVWQAPDECPSDARIRSAVDALLSRPAFTDGDAELTVRGRIERTTEPGIPFRATLRLSTAEGTAIGERVVSLESPECADALAPVSLVLSLMIDVSRREISLRVPAPRPVPPTLDSPTVDSPTANSPTVDSPTDSPVVSPTSPADEGSTTASSGRRRASVAVGGGVVHQLVPGTMALVDVRAGLQVDVWSVEAWFELVPRGTATLDDAAVDAWAGLAGVSLCGLPRAASSVSLGLCAEVGGGFTASEGRGLAQTRSARRPQAVLGLAARLRVGLRGPWGVRVEVGGRALVVRDRLRLAPGGEPTVVFEPWPVVPFAALWVDLAL